MNKFIEQLKRTNSIDQSQEKQIRENYKGIHLHSKVENKPVISRLSNNIIVTKSYHLFEFKEVSGLEDFYNNINDLNDFPNPHSDFDNPVLEMEASIDLIFKNDV